MLPRPFSLDTPRCFYSISRSTSSVLITFVQRPFRQYVPAGQQYGWSLVPQTRLLGQQPSGRQTSYFLQHLIVPSANTQQCVPGGQQ